MAEFATQAKACIIVPNPQLTGGHQLKNAQVLERAGAAIVLEENQLSGNPKILADAISLTLQNPDRRTKLGQQLHHFAHPDATKRLAELILDMIS